MKSSSLRTALLAAAIVAVTPHAPALAQSDVKERAEEIAEQANAVQKEAGELANDVAATEGRDEADRDGAANAAAAGDRDDGDRNGDGDGGKWGLLGLLGLAGLLGLRRRDNHVHTDANRTRL